MRRSDAALWRGARRAPLSVVGAVMAAMFLPAHCAVCVRVGSPLCPGCARLLVPAAESPVAGLDASVALFSYEGAGRTVIARLKFSNHRDALRPLGRSLALAAGRVVRPDLVTWVPTTPRRRRSRGFDQAELLAVVVAGELGVPHRRTVRRVGVAPQAGRGRAERWEASFLGTCPVPPTVLVVDDVRTTGASLAAVAAALRSGGARHVVGATLAATPSHGVASGRASSTVGLTNGSPFGAGSVPPSRGNRRPTCRST